MISRLSPSFLTTPLSSDYGFELGQIEKSGGMGKEGCCSEMDSASAAYVCEGKQIPCGIIVGISVPALVKFPNDSERNLQKNWGEFFIKYYALAAAANACTVVKRICENV